MDAIEPRSREHGRVTKRTARPDTTPRAFAPSLNEDGTPSPASRPRGRVAACAYSAVSRRAMRDFLFAALLAWMTPLLAALSSSRAASW